MVLSGLELGLGVYGPHFSTRAAVILSSSLSFWTTSNRVGHCIASTYHRRGL